MVTCFPALAIGYMFSRACHGYMFSRAWHELHIFALSNLAPRCSRSTRVEKIWVRDYALSSDWPRLVHLVYLRLLTLPACCDWPNAITLVFVSRQSLEYHSNRAKSANKFKTEGKNLECYLQNCQNKLESTSR